MYHNFIGIHIKAIVSEYFVAVAIESLIHLMLILFFVSLT